MKRLTPHSLDAVQARHQHGEYLSLLQSKTILSEAKDILPFFRKRNDLSILIGNYFPAIRRADVLAHEFQIYGDFRADLIVGDSKATNYLLVEFEDGSPQSIFGKSSSKATPAWARRFEGAFSQLVDWLWKLEDMRSTVAFEHTFGGRDAKFQGLIVIGKDMTMDAQEQSRLKWRIDKVLVDSKYVSCVSFNDLANDLDFWLRQYHNA